MSEYKQILLELPIFLCDKHLESHPERFVVKYCSGWSFVAIPTKNYSNSCCQCIGEYKPLIYLSRAYLFGANLSRANLSRAYLLGTIYSEYTVFDEAFKKSKEFKELILR